jgi:glycerophosphoryl diester phosphodiesterase family protein
LPSSPFTPQLRPLSIGEVVDAGFRLLRHRLGTLILCVIAAGIPFAIARTVIFASTNPDYYDVNAIAFADEADDAARIIGWYLGQLVVGLGAALAVAACFRLISAAYLGERTGAGASLAAGLRRMPALVVAFVVLAVTLLFLALTARGIYITAPLVVYLAVKWSMTFPAIVGEHKGPFAAMRRSWQLTRGQFWRTLASLALLGVVTFVLWLIISVAAFYALTSWDSVSEITLATLDTVSAVATLALIYPLVAAILTVLYYDMRVRGEGFDLQLLARDVGADTARSERPEPALGMPSPVPVASSGGGFAPPEELSRY